MLLTSGLLFIAMRESMFGLMERKSMHVSDFFLLPKDSVILIGRQVAI
ncbi:hypothetical protein [Collimonas humicola]|nr:hypothetical protein [Collimonas humicola]